MKFKYKITLVMLLCWMIPCDLLKWISSVQVSRERWFRWQSTDAYSEWGLLMITESNFFIHSAIAKQTEWEKLGVPRQRTCSLPTGMLWSNLLCKSTVVMQCYILRWSDTSFGHIKVQCCLGMGPMFRFTGILLSRVLREVYQTVTISYLSSE